MWKHKKFIVLAAIAVVLVLYLGLRPRLVRLGVVRVDASVRGRRDAQKDLDSGHYVQLGFGTPLAWNSEFDQCLGQYGIEVRNVGGDVFQSGRDVSTGTDLSYYQSYNATTSIAIKQKFGPDVFERCMDTARRSWERSRQTSPPKELLPTGDSAHCPDDECNRDFSPINMPLLPQAQKNQRELPGANRATGDLGDH